MVVRRKTEVTPEQRSRGQRIQRARKAAGFSQGDIAARLHVDKSTVARWESGHLAPTYERMRELAELYSRDSGHLAYGGDPDLDSAEAAQ